MLQPVFLHQPGWFQSCNGCRNGPSISNKCLQHSWMKMQPRNSINLHYLLKKSSQSAAHSPCFFLPCRFIKRWRFNRQESQNATLRYFFGQTHGSYDVIVGSSAVLSSSLALAKVLVSNHLVRQVQKQIIQVGYQISRAAERCSTTVFWLWVWTFSKFEL